MTSTSQKMRPDPKPPQAAPRARRPFLEIQYHPGDIRRGVRYYFLSRQALAGWCVGLLLYAAFLVVGLILTPTVIGNVLAQREYESLQEERAAEGTKLKVHLDRLAALENDSAQTLLQMSKIYLAYGLTGESRGQGGYPESPSVVPDSIFAAEIGRANELTSGVHDHMEALRVFLDEVDSFETANKDQVRTTPSLSPLRRDTFVLTSPYGTRRSPFTKEIDFHAGIDLAATIGTPLSAPADGTVTFAGRYPLKRSVGWWRYGNLVALRHGERFMTLYGHCEDILVKVGDKVQQGHPIATVGNTGWSTNPHLHYEVRRLDDDGEWRPVDPRIYILDHRWSDEEQVLIRARKTPSAQEYEPIPSAIARK